LRRLDNSLALFRPVTSQIKGYPFETPLPPALAVRGAVLCDQIKSLDSSAIQAEFICQLPEDTLADVMAKSRALLN
jgi:mRNA interferase MazF